MLISCPHSHTGPVWQVAWAHPKFGNILASCSYDGQVLIWREQTQGPSAGTWTKIKEHSLHTASGTSTSAVLMQQLYLTIFRCTVNSISWAPHELGAILACASSDGKLSVLTFKGPFRIPRSLALTLTFLLSRRRPVGRRYFPRPRHWLQRRFLGSCYPPWLAHTPPSTWSTNSSRAL